MTESAPKVSNLFSPTQEHLAIMRKAAAKYPDRYTFAECLTFFETKAPNGNTFESLVFDEERKGILRIGLTIGALAASENVQKSDTPAEAMAKIGGLVADADDWCRSDA